MTYSATALQTKKIYIKQHENYGKDERLFARFLSFAMDPTSYDLPAGWIEGKTVLDAGCGNTGYFQVAMHRLGAHSVTCIDIGTDWQAPLAEVMRTRNVPASFITCHDASTTSLPFPDNTFDFAASNGVLQHLESVAMAETALSELHRVTKTGGYLYGYMGFDAPGILDRFVVPALRQAYKEDAEFREFIDTIDHEKVGAQLIEIFNSARTNDPSLFPGLGEALAQLFTIDSTTFFQNTIQVPMQLGPKLGENWARERFAALGMKNIRRIKERYWKRDDFRKYLAPLHHRLDVPLARMLYGNGHVKMIAEKA